MNPENKEKAKKLFSQLETLEYYKKVWEQATKFRVPMIELDSPNPDEYPNVPLNLISFDILKKNYLHVINKKIEAINEELEQL